MRKSLGYLSIAALAVGLISCADIISGTSPNGARRALLAIAPQFEAGANQTAAALANGGLSFDHVRVFVVRPATDTLADTTIAYLPTDTAQTLVLAVLAIPNDSLVVTMQYKSGTTVLFEGSAATKAVAMNAATNATNTVTIPVTYIGPGATAKTISMLPATTAITSATTTTFSAKAFDIAGLELTNAPIAWGVSDTNVATINATSGVLTPKVARGEITVTADLPSAHASRSFQLAPQASGLRVVQGAAQIGSPGSTLLPVVIQLVAADGLPGLAAGLTATFAANGGGSITPASVALDAEGRAQATVTLGASAGGVYLFTATAGTFSVVFPEIAKVGPPTQLIPSGSTSFPMTAGVAPSPPLPTFRVADALGNSVPFVALKAIIRLGVDTTVTPTFFADTIGVGDVSKIAAQITKAGAYTVTFASADPTVSFPALTYNVTVSAAAASKLAFGVQPSSAQANVAISPAITILIQDQYGNTVTNATTSVTMVLDPPTTSGMQLNGTKVVSAVNGVATFSTLSMTPAKTAVKLTATAGTLAAVTSNAFNITP